MIIGHCCLGCVLSSSHLGLPVLLCQAIPEQIFGKRGPHSSDMNQLMLKKGLFNYYVIYQGGGGVNDEARKENIKDF